MSDISALESRITAALDRIRRGVDAQQAGAMQAQAAMGQADADLQTELDNERAANADLIEKLRVFKERQDTDLAGLTQRVEQQRVQLAAYDAELQKLRAAGEQMRIINARLRETAATGVAPELLNDAMTAELAALVALRSADVAEIDVILAELIPLIEETTDAAD